MKKYAVLDGTDFKYNGKKGRLVREYWGARERYLSPFNDLTTYKHVEVPLDQDSDGFFINDNGDLEYDFGYKKPDPSDYKPKIYRMVNDSVSRSKDFRSINYKTELIGNLYPKRTKVQGEVRKVEWYSDPELTDKVIEVDVVYNRDSIGFATDRTTTRTWFNGDGTPNPVIKVTNKRYDINTEDQIVEGRKRRQNIVNSVQQPTLAFMIETLIGNPYPTVDQILLVGREFMDSMNDEFKKFVDNSSSITDFEDPNFNRKSVVVAFETRATTDADWLNNTPAVLGGGSILDYLVGEFSI